MAAINYTQGIDELGRWLYKQVVKCPAGNDNRARVRPLSHASLDSHSWLSVLPGKGCSRKRPSAFLGRCLLAGMRNQRRRLAIGEALSEQPSGYATTIRFAPGTSQQAPSCRQGAATQRSGHASAPPEKTSVLGLSAGPLGSRYGPPVLIPCAANLALQGGEG
jgi:hypothetical protein